MPENRFYKKEFTPEEYEECFAWFDARMDQLPPSLKLSPALTINDLPSCVRVYVHKLRKQARGNPNYNGQFALLLMMREHLQQLGL